MNIEQLVREVEEVFQSLDKEIADFQQWSGLHCKTGCGKCCLKPDIEATVLEFIPFAYYLHRQGKAIEWIENSNFNQPVCLILDSNPTGIGHCMHYLHRGMICRLFGFSARKNKHGMRELVTCQVIKTEQSGAFLLASAVHSSGSPAPLMRDYYMRLHSIDGELSQKFYPINVAIKKAIETVLHYFSYREDSGVTF